MKYETKQKKTRKTNKQKINPVKKNLNTYIT